MEVHELAELPVDCYGKKDQLDEYEITDLEKLGVEEAWYWYATAPSEGEGQLLIRVGNAYSLHDMGHCSCYGPTGMIKINLQPLDMIESSCTPELLKEVQCLFDAARSQS